MADNQQSNKLTQGIIDECNLFFKGIYDKNEVYFHQGNIHNIKFDRLGIICLYCKVRHYQLNISLTVAYDMYKNQYHVVISVQGSITGNFALFSSKQVSHTLFDAYHNTMRDVHPYMKKNPN